MISSVPLALAYLVLEKHNSSFSWFRIKKKPFLVGKGVVRKPPNSLLLDITLPWDLSNPAAISMLSPQCYLLFPPFPSKGAVDSLTHCPKHGPNSCVTKHSWGSLDSQRSLTETKMKESAAECSGVIWALKSDKPEFKSQLHSASAMQTWTNHFSKVWFPDL